MWCCRRRTVGLAVALLLLLAVAIDDAESCADNSNLQSGEFIEPNVLCFVRVDNEALCLSVVGYKCNVDPNNRTAGVPTNAQWNEMVAPSASVLMPSEWLDRNSLGYTLRVLWTCGPNDLHNPSAALSRRTFESILDDGLAVRMWLQCTPPIDVATGRTSAGLCTNNRLDNQILSAQRMGRPLSDDALIALLANDSTCS